MPAILRSLRMPLLAQTRGFSGLWLYFLIGAAVNTLLACRYRHLFKTAQSPKGFKFSKATFPNVFGCTVLSVSLQNPEKSGGTCFRWSWLFQSAHTMENQNQCARYIVAEQTFISCFWPPYIVVQEGRLPVWGFFRTTTQNRQILLDIIEENCITSIVSRKQLQNAACTRHLKCFLKGLTSPAFDFGVSLCCAYSATRLYCHPPTTCPLRNPVYLLWAKICFLFLKMFLEFASRFMKAAAESE